MPASLTDDELRALAYFVVGVGTEATSPQF